MKKMTLTRVTKLEKKKIRKEGVYIREYEGKDLLNEEILNHGYNLPLSYSLEVIKLSNEILELRGGSLNRSKYVMDALINVSFKYKLLEKEYGEELKTSEIREKLYQEGFKLNGTKYIRYKRTASSARQGKCLFIKESLYQKMMEYSGCGLDLEKNSKNLPKLEAYLSLTTSSLIDTIRINPKNILVIPDYESVFSDDVMATTLSEDKKYITTAPRRESIRNSIFDGQSLIDISLLSNKYKEKGGIQLRNKFFKGMAFNTNIQKFFKDNNITEIKQLNVKGQTIAEKIEDILFITTPSSIKYLAFGNFEDWLKNIDTNWGICSTDNEKEKINNIEGLVSTHYQLLNTLNLTYLELEKVLEPQITYINDLMNEQEILINHLKLKNTDDIYLDENNFNSVMLELLKHNIKIRETKMFERYISGIKNSMLLNIKDGHILIDGNYEVLFSNSYEMLLHSIGKFDEHNTILGKDEIYTKMFGNNEKLMGIRSPHVTMGNILISTNRHKELIDKYFNSSNEIVHINSCQNNILERLSGADMDGDHMLITNNKILIKVAQKHYHKFLVPTNCIINENKNIEYNLSAKSKSELDVKTSVNLIGEIINLSQHLNSYYWDRLNNKTLTKEKLEMLYALICELDILSCIEIDKAKKPSPIDMEKAIERIKSSACEILNISKIQKAMYFKNKKKRKDGRKGIKNEEYRWFDTTIDYLIKKMSRRNFKFNNNNITLISAFFKENVENRKLTNLKIEKINNIVNEYRVKSKGIYNEYSEKMETSSSKIEWHIFKDKKILEIQNEAINNLKKLKLEQYIKDILLEIDNKYNRQIKEQNKSYITNELGTTLKLIYISYKKEVKALIRPYKKKVPVLEVDIDGDIDIFGRKLSVK